MRRFFPTALLVGCGTLCAAGCGDVPMAGPPDLGPDGLRPQIGFGCSASVPCATAAVCLTCGFPGGYCSAPCSDTTPCPDGARCVSRPDLGGGFCFKACATSDECAGQTRCDPEQRVCLPELDAVVPGTREGQACVTPVVDPAQGPHGPFGANVQVTSDQSSGQAECSLAVDAAGQRLALVYMEPALALLGATSSGDGGASWATPITLPPDRTVDKNAVQADPTVAIDPSGDFWVAWFGVDPALPFSTNLRVYAARSTDGGASFGPVLLVSPADEATSALLDKPWMAVSPDGTLYLSWMRSDTAMKASEIRMARSADQGQRWTVQTVSDTSRALFRNLAQTVAGQDGSVYASWLELSGDPLGSPANQIYLARLAPDGTPRGPNVLVSRPEDSPTFDDPSVAVSGGNVYVGFVSGTACGAWDVRVAASLDGGASFGPSVKVNDDPSCATHFHHQIAVDQRGNLHAVWYDNRYLAGNVFYASSGPADAMNPLRFGANTFVSDASFSFLTGRDDAASWLGDYLALVATPGALFAAWADNRDGLSHIYFARAPLP